MNPPTRQKPKHDRPLGREHIRVLLRLPFGLFLLAELGARVVDDLAISSLDNAPRWVRWRAEFVWLFEYTRFLVRGFC